MKKDSDTRNRRKRWRTQDVWFILRHKDWSDKVLAGKFGRTPSSIRYIKVMLKKNRKKMEELAR